MKSRLFTDTATIMKTFVIVMMSVVLLTQSPVSAQSAAMTNQAATAQSKTLISKIKTELERRSAQLLKAQKAVESSNALSPAVKKTMLTTITTAQTAAKDLYKQIDKAEDLGSIKKLALEVDKLYDQYASANATAMTVKDGDTQQESFTQLETVADDTQAMIDAAGASGKDVGNLQDQMKNIDQLIQSIGAIVASVIALIASLTGGNFTSTTAIFETIFAQLSQNLTTIGTAQTELGGIVEVLNGFQGLNAEYDPSKNTGNLKDS